MKGYLETRTTLYYLGARGKKRELPGWINVKKTGTGTANVFEEGDAKKNIGDEECR